MTRFSAERDPCPWCDEPITSAADPVTVSPEKGRSTGETLHHDCAVEWQTFIERAKDLATSGKRYSLIDGPLEKGWEFETGT